MLKLVHLFKLIFFTVSVISFVFISILVATITTHAQLIVNKKDLLYADRALLSIDKRVWFVSEINLLTKSIQRLRCDNFSSVLLKSVGLDVATTVELPYLANEIKQIRQQNSYLDKLIGLMKLMHFIEGVEDKKIVIDVKKQKMVTQPQGCLTIDSSSWGHRMRALIRLEFFLRDRFSQENAKIDGLEQSIKLYVGTVSSKIKHEIYY